MQKYIIKNAAFPFLSYYPLKQGLKPNLEYTSPVNQLHIFILLSIKTRIETASRCICK